MAPTERTPLAARAEYVPELGEPSTPGRGDEPPSRCLAVCASQGPLATVLVTCALALVHPGWGAKGGVLQYEVAIPAIIMAVFFLIGLTVPLESLKAGTRAFSFHAACQGVSLGLVPGLYYLTIYAWGFDRWVLTEDFSKGVMCALCMPTTCFTCVMFTAQAGGCEAVAVFNAALGNILGPVVSPVTARLALGGSEKAAMHGGVLGLLAQLFVPLLLGAATQQAVERYRPDWCPAVRVYSKSTFNVLLFVALYYIFCEGFHTPSHDITPTTIALMVAWVFVLYLVVFCVCWCVGLWLPVQRRIALAFVASQKTEGMAVAILAIISTHSGPLTLPVVAYHSVQMTVSAVIVPEIRRWAEAHDEAARDEEDMLRMLAPPSPWESARSPSFGGASTMYTRLSGVLPRASATSLAQLASHGSLMDLAD